MAQAPDFWLSLSVGQIHFIEGVLKMKNKLFCAALLISVLAAGFMVAGCASLNNLLNPMYAIDGNGEKIAVTLGSSSQQCTIGETAYSYQNRPTVPIAPRKPVSPGNPPSEPDRPSDPSGTITYHVSGRAITESWSNEKELKQLLQKPLDEFSRVNLQSQHNRESPD